MPRGRKSKYIIKFNNGRKIWRVAIYIRLSSDDKDGNDESNSVSNQRELLTLFLKNESDIVIVDYYIDDGYSGTNFNRPDFMRMLNDIKNGKVNCIIVKDLSRFGRNHIEVGNYLEQILPLFNVRFISVNDNIDSYKNPDSISNAVVPVKNLMNEEHCRDTSNKVKAVLKTMKRNGDFCAGQVPYGYKKDENNKYHLVIDKEPAKVIKYIFQLALEGNGITKIVKTLNDKEIPSPKQYMITQKGINDNTPHYWGTTQVRRILKNEVYCGDMIQSKYRVVSYKIHKEVENKKEDWIIVRNTHEAIIDRITFRKVQEYIAKRNNNKGIKNNISLFAGVLRCNECKKTMIKKQATSNKSDIYNYYCSTYNKKSNNLCTKHKIRSDKLEEMVLQTIKVQISLVIDIDRTIKEITKANKEVNSEKNLKAELQEEIEKNKRIRKSVYEDWKLELISQEEYFEYIKEYENNIKECTEKIEQLDKILANKKMTENNSWIDKFKEYQNITKLTRQTIKDLIDKIYIHENENITIVFKYQDEYKQALDLIKNTSERSA